MKTIFDRMRDRGNNLCVGLDPDRGKMPTDCQGCDGLRKFSSGVIGTVAPYVGVVKVQSAFFEAEGGEGMSDMGRVMSAARDYGLATILDSKRGDIPNTAKQYVKYAFNYYRADALTIQPWMGESCIRAFVDGARGYKAGIFVIVSPTSADQEPWLAQQIAVTNMSQWWLMDFVSRISSENIIDGYGDVGVVVGPASVFLKNYRQEFPHVPFLVPGVGAQGGSIESLSGIPGLVVAVSRSILYPGGDGPWKDNVAAACKAMIENGKKKA